jgi:hypothetical protein
MFAIIFYKFSHLILQYYYICVIFSHPNFLH